MDWRPAAIVLAGLFAYASSFSGPFIFDDFGAIVRNTSIHDVWNLRAVLSPPDATPVAGRLLANLSFAVNYAVGGLDVVGYHVVSLAFHLMCGVLLYSVIRRTFDAANLAFAIALVWTVHPLISEVVLYLTERTESMMALCYLFTIYASARAAVSPRPVRWLWAGVVACAAGTLCKEVMVTAPFMVAVYDRVFLFTSIGDAFRARWRFYSGLAASWLIVAASMLSHGSISSGGFESARTTTWTYLLNQTVIVTRYLRLVVWPRPLVLYYGWTRALTLADVWPYALFVAILAAASVVVFVRWPRFGFPAVWTIVTLSPSSSIAAIAAEVGAERRMYLPLMGILTLAIVGTAVALRSRAVVSSSRAAPGATDRIVVFASAILAIVLGASTFARARDYTSALTMARTVLAGWESPSAHQLVGQELAAAGQHDEAISELRKALPEATPAHYFLGSELVNAGKLDEGIAELQEFVRLEPSLVPTKSARMLLVRAFAAKQQWPQAIEQLNALLAATPSDAVVHGLLADIFAGQKAFAEAIPHYRSFLQANPRDGNAWTGLGVALVSTGQPGEAASAFRQAANADPKNGRFRQNLARVLLESGDAAGAVREAQQAVALDPNDAAAHEVLGRALAAQGSVGEARRELERALQIDPSYAPARDALKAIGRIG
jgi:tetratricopeptide (TPR) repeat protein